MKKIVLVPLIIWNLHAETFDALKQDALKSSPYLQANALNIERAEEESKILQRYKNPTLSLEASRFTPETGASGSGYRGALSQPVRLWGVGSAREKLGKATQKKASSMTKLKRAEFLRELSLLYIGYVQQSKLFALAQDELKIAQKIATISKERYEAGTITKARYLLAEVDALNAKNQVNLKEADKLSSYWQLLAFSGIKEEIELDASYEFVRSDKKSVEDSARLEFLRSTQKRAQQEALLNSNKIQWLNLYAEYEKEPDQKIARVGLDIPLALFNTKKEERRIATLEAKQSEYLVKNQEIALTHTLTRINAELEILYKVLHSTQTLYNSQKELLDMYEKGYKIANINLIELQNIKNKMIETKEKEIAIQSKIDTDIVLYNYETGEYND